MTACTFDDDQGSQRAPSAHQTPPGTVSAEGGGSTEQAADASGSATGPAAGGHRPSQEQSGCSQAVPGDVAFSWPSGTFAESISVELSTRLADVSIRYTVDGTVPTSSSPIYDGTPLSIDKTTRLRAQAFAGAVPKGAPSAGIYVTRAIDSDHDVPVIVLDAYAAGRASTQDRSFQDVAFLGFEPADGMTSLNAEPAVTSLAAYHAHGQSSVMFAKSSYRIELRDYAGDDRDCALFGMPKEADWLLIGPFADKTLIHNAFVFSLGKELGLLAPRLTLIELFVNVGDRPMTSSNYYGVYQLIEKIEIQKDRISLKQLRTTDTTEPEITGGYIFKSEWLATEPPLLPCPEEGEGCWTDMELVEPQAPNVEQMAYLTSHLKAFNDAMHSAAPSDPVSGYPAYLDVQSFVDHVIINELTRSMDAYVRSQYFHKQRGGKIVAGPLWDFDLIAGVGMGASGLGGRAFPNLDTAGWQYESNASRMTSNWFSVLLADPDFRAQLVARWIALRRGLLSEASIAGRIEMLTQGLENAASRNFLRWQILSQPMVMPFTTPVEPTWHGQVEYMKNWLVQRAAWLDTQWL
ncbi:CotH kinase family protein [Myxococcota bacterium]